MHGRRAIHEESKNQNDEVPWGKSGSGMALFEGKINYHHICLLQEASHAVLLVAQASRCLPDSTPFPNSTFKRDTVFILQFRCQRWQQRCQGKYT